MRMPIISTAVLAAIGSLVVPIDDDDQIVVTSVEGWTVNELADA